jgi:hypothetical protein
MHEHVFRLEIPPAQKKADPWVDHKGLNSDGSPAYVMDNGAAICIKKSVLEHRHGPLHDTRCAT